MSGTGGALVRGLSLNQDQSCFTCAMEDGLRIYNVEPLKEKLRLEFDQVGSISKVRMLNRSNVLAILSGPPKPKFGAHQIMIWDNVAEDFVMEYSLSQDVLNVELCKDKLIALTRNRVYVFSFPDNSTKLFELETRLNPLGVCQLACQGNRQVFATLGNAMGTVQVVDLTLATKSYSAAPVTISAHQNEIACMAINHNASMIATASHQGTLIRIFDLNTRQKLTEVRRGSDQARITCINFNRDSSLVCVTSDKETVHVFSLNLRHHRSSKAGKVAALQHYTDSQRSFCKFPIDRKSVV